jgi:hypothetical protein
LSKRAKKDRGYKRPRRTNHPRGVRGRKADQAAGPAAAAEDAAAAAEGDNKADKRERTAEDITNPKERRQREPTSAAPSTSRQEDGTTAGSAAHTKRGDTKPKQGNPNKHLILLDTQTKVIINF